MKRERSMERRERGLRGPAMGPGHFKRELRANTHYHGRTERTSLDLCTVKEN